MRLISTATETKNGNTPVPVMSQVEKDIQATHSSGASDFGDLVRYMKLADLKIPWLGAFWTLIQYTIVVLGCFTLWAIVTVRGIVVCCWYFFAVAVSHIGWAYYLTQESDTGIGFNLTTAGAVVTGAGTLLAPLLMEHASATLKTQSRNEWDFTKLLEGLSGVGLVFVIMYADVRMLKSGLLASSLENPGLATDPEKGFAQVLAIGIAGGSYFIAKQVAMHTLFKLVAQLASYKEIADNGKAGYTGDPQKDAELTKGLQQYKTAWIAGICAIGVFGLLHFSGFNVGGIRF